MESTCCVARHRTFSQRFATQRVCVSCDLGLGSKRLNLLTEKVSSDTLVALGIAARIQRLTNELSIKGKGYVALSFTDTKTMLRTVKVPAYYILQSLVSLLRNAKLLQSYSVKLLLQTLAEWC